MGSLVWETVLYRCLGQIFILIMEVSRSQNTFSVIKFSKRALWDRSRLDWLEWNVLCFTAAKSVQFVFIKRESYIALNSFSTTFNEKMMKFKSGELKKKWSK